MKRPGLLVTMAVAVAATALITWGVASLSGDTQEPMRAPSLSLSQETSSTTSTIAAGSIDGSETIRELSEAASDPAQRETSPAGTSQSSGAEEDPADPGSDPSGDTGADPTEDPADDPAAPVVIPDLTLEQRKACYWDLVGAQDRAVAEAEAAYPLDSDTADVEAHLALRSSLTEKYEAEVAQEYGISAAELDAIAREGIDNGWPMPPLES